MESSFKLREKRKTVLAIGEGEDEKIFIRYLVQLYCRRNKVSVSSSSAGGCCPSHILDYAIKFTRGFKRDVQFILLDTDIEWPPEMISRAEKESIELIGNEPCFESFLFEILLFPDACEDIGSSKCKNFFLEKCPRHRFNEEACQTLFPKSLLNKNRKIVPKLDKIIKILEGNF